MSAWGGGGPAAKPRGAPIVKDELQECEICFDAWANVRASPCGHECCRKCLGRWRSTTILKSLKGTPCPFCRSVVQSEHPVVLASGEEPAWVPRPDAEIKIRRSEAEEVEELRTRFHAAASPKRVRRQLLSESSERHEPLRAPEPVRAPSVTTPSTPEAGSGDSLSALSFEEVFLRNDLTEAEVEQMLDGVRPPRFCVQSSEAGRVDAPLATPQSPPRRLDTDTSRIDRSVREDRQLRGKVVRLCAGFGFIRSSGLEDDVFFHFTELKWSELEEERAILSDDLHLKMEVMFSLAKRRQKTVAVRLCRPPKKRAAIPPPRVTHAKGDLLRHEAKTAILDTLKESSGPAVGLSIAIEWKSRFMDRGLGNLEDFIKNHVPDVIFKGTHEVVLADFEGTAQSASAVAPNPCDRKANTTTIDPEAVEAAVLAALKGAGGKLDQSSLCLKVRSILRLPRRGKLRWPARSNGVRRREQTKGRTFGVFIRGIEGVNVRDDERNESGSAYVYLSEARSGGVKRSTKSAALRATASSATGTSVEGTLASAKRAVVATAPGAKSEVREADFAVSPKADREAPSPPTDAAQSSESEGVNSSAGESQNLRLIKAASKVVLERLRSRDDYREHITSLARAVGWSYSEFKIFGNFKKFICDFLHPVGLAEFDERTKLVTLCRNFHPTRLMSDGGNGASSNDTELSASDVNTTRAGTATISVDALTNKKESRANDKSEVAKEPWLRVGNMVKVEGLSVHTSFNGRNAVIDQINLSNGRVKITLCNQRNDPENAGKHVYVRTSEILNVLPTNLRPIERKSIAVIEKCEDLHGAVVARAALKVATKSVRAEAASFVPTPSAMAPSTSRARLAAGSGGVRATAQVFTPTAATALIAAAKAVVNESDTSKNPPAKNIGKVRAGARAFEPSSGGFGTLRSEAAAFDSFASSSESSMSARMHPYARSASHQASALYAHQGEEDGYAIDAGGAYMTSYSEAMPYSEAIAYEHAAMSPTYEHTDDVLPSVTTVYGSDGTMFDMHSMAYADQAQGLHHAHHLHSSYDPGAIYYG